MDGTTSIATGRTNQAEHLSSGLLKMVMVLLQPPASSTHSAASARGSIVFLAPFEYCEGALCAILAKTATTHKLVHHRHCLPPLIPTFSCSLKECLVVIAALHLPPEQACHKKPSLSFLFFSQWDAMMPDWNAHIDHIPIRLSIRIFHM